VAKTFLSCLLLWLPLAFSSGVRPLVVVGSSMDPALRPGQVALLHRDYYRAHPLEHGDVVAFRWKGYVYVKRVDALAGDRLELACNGSYCYPAVSGTEAKLRRLAQRDPTVGLRTVVVPPGCFFALGDNIPASIDSRELGPIPTTAILGRVESLAGSMLPPAPA
jgi:signal peptidase I